MPTSKATTYSRWARQVAGSVLLVLHADAAAVSGPVVAVAANMSGTATEMADRFREETGMTVRLSFGASGNLARQILRGAPYELFLSADVDYPYRLHEAGVTDSSPQAYAEGRLTLYIAPDAGLAPRDEGENDAVSIRTVLTGGAISRLAIANPNHAPYGRAARQVLEHLSLWRAYQGRLAIGENVTQAARFARTRSVGAALLPLSVALEPALADGRHLSVPAEWHTPIEQHLVVLAGASETARRFGSFVLGPEGRAILQRRGYALPGHD